jgi:hypothetical protein
MLALGFIETTANRIFHGSSSAEAVPGRVARAMKRVISNAAKA